MESENLNTNWVTEAFKAFEQSLNGGKDLPIHAVRKGAYERFNKDGFPTTKNENWRYTDTSVIARNNFKVNTVVGVADLKQESINNILLKECADSALVFVDGNFSPIFSRWNVPSEIVEFSTIFKMISDKNTNLGSASEVLRHFENEEGQFGSLGTAFLRDGVFLKLKKGARLVSPVQLIFVTTANSNQALTTPRVHLVAEESSSMEIVETHFADNAESYLSTSYCDIRLEQNASVKYQKIELEALSAFHMANVRVRQARDSNFSSNFFSFGGKLVRNEVVITIAGTGCHTEINGLTVINGDQHVDNNTTLDHAEPHCQSVERFKGIYADKSHGVFQGTIIVRQDAQKTNAIQSNQSILLSKDAAIDTKPQLKIWADDVKCTHGATVGQLDENALFYIRSRGVDKETARNMLVHAFASDIISGISIASLKEFLEAELLKKLDEA